MSFIDIDIIDPHFGEQSQNAFAFSKQTPRLCLKLLHMQDMSFKLKQLFLRRKHKLFKSLSQNAPPTERDAIISQKDITNLYEMILNKQNQNSQIDYFIKHGLYSDLAHYITPVMDILWSLLNIRSGTFLSFVTYRLCRKYPASYWLIVNFISKKLQNKQGKSLQQVIFLTDLYLYGFSIDIEEFMNHFLTNFHQYLLDLLPKYIHILQSNQFFPLKNQKIFQESFQNWMQQSKKVIQSQYSDLLSKSRAIQQNLIKEIEKQAQELSYISRLESYETQLYRFSNAMQNLNASFNSDEYKLKSIFQLRKECKTFKLSFQYSEYERSLYLGSKAFTELKPMKKSEMLKLQENEAYVSRVKLCSNIKQCIDLSGYFLEQLNLQHNRQELIEIIINDCYNYNNISYILKIILEISQFQPSLYEYCCNKGRKICAQSKMNLKYQKLLCEMSRFKLMDENILLDYAEKILKLQNNQVTKEVESILQNLGTMIYYRSLQTHTRINAIFERIELMIKSKLVHFNIEHLFHLKGLLNYLRNHSNKISMAGSEEIAELEIKTNFQFIFKKMEKLLKENQLQKIVDFVSAGIDQQDFLNSYYYASLVKDLNQKEVNRMLHENTLTSINNSLEEFNTQRSVCWSRFLGELYNYQIINRKKLIENLNEILQKHQVPTLLSGCLKCICSTLETAKYYLKQSEINRDKKQVIFILIELKKCLIIGDHFDKALCDEVSEIIEYFHPYLSAFTSLHQIDALFELSVDPSSKHNIYALLDLLQNGADLEQLKSTHRAESKRRYFEKDKIQSEKKWIEKQIKYKEKPLEQTYQKSEMQLSRQSPSKQSTKAEEPRETITQKKQIKVMGRSRGDKKIKVITCSYTDQSNEP